MRVFRSLSEVPADFGPSVITIGNFDGVHAGHREIMRRVAALARERGLTPTVMTFDPHPARVLAPARAPRLIQTIGQRVRSLQQEGIEAALLIPFSLEFAALSPEEFARDVLARFLKARVVLVGEDFRFGYKQAGNIDTLRELGARYGFELQSVGAVEGGSVSGKGKRVSSTQIRELVASGKVSRACRLMGAPFALEGAVVSGQGIGSKKTVPTLNLAFENELAPKVGVYVTRTRDDAGREWQSITNVGYRPTFDGGGLTVETFLLNGAPEPSPVRIEVTFLTFVRDEVRFETPELLKARILRDVGTAKRFHARFARLRVG